MHGFKFLLVRVHKSHKSCGPHVKGEIPYQIRMINGHMDIDQTDSGKIDSKWAPRIFNSGGKADFLRRSCVASLSHRPSRDRALSSCCLLQERTSIEFDSSMANFSQPKLTTSKRKVPIIVVLSCQTLQGQLPHPGPHAFNQSGVEKALPCSSFRLERSKCWVSFYEYPWIGCGPSHSERCRNLKTRLVTTRLNFERFVCACFVRSCFCHFCS